MVTLSGAIDRQSSTPYYQQLVDALDQRLSSGQIPQGHRLPSENELCKEFGLSRATVRQALQVLESQGLVTRIANRGVFANRTPAADEGWTIQQPQGFLENALSHQNRSVTTQVLRHGPTVLPAFACQLLKVPEKTAGYELVRLRTLNEVPALYSINYSPSELVPVIAASDEVLEGRASLSQVLAKAGYTLGGAHRSVRAVAPTPEIAAALDIRPTTPVLHIRSTSWTPSGQHYDVYNTWVRSDVVPLEVNVDATGS
ncbi:GntR family transcriptional regulator [Streptomyces sp. 5-6(2022)]|uniref:GntR family transcriptional regulator n=1 Tax=Streptomyces sp. 5-6(2022) TaxID=2936510 RepID=UPI0023B9016B|nr:GntR family transcriptional regulator [Streptomyces sp. 5-6(2022)]